METGVLELLRWGWIVIALFFFIAEIFTAGFVLMCFGFGALGAALVAFLGLGLEWQLVAFIVVSVLAVALSRPFAERVIGRGPQHVAIDRVLGKRAVVLQAIDPVLNTGMVRVDTEEWRAESMDGRAIPVGAIVEVKSVDGVRLRVRPVSEPATPDS